MFVHSLVEHPYRGSPGGSSRLSSSESVGSMSQILLILSLISCGYTTVEDFTSGAKSLYTGYSKIKLYMRNKIIIHRTVLVLIILARMVGCKNKTLRVTREALQ